MKTVSLLQCCVLMVLQCWGTTEAKGKIDVCTLPKDPGPCKAAFPRYFFNSESGRCEEFTYGGCQGNDNRFDTLQQCGEQCGDVCTLPKDPGPCRGSFPKYFFNSESGRCEEFTYGGCQGNDNRFDTVQPCGEQCGDVCALPKDPGPCRGSFPKYFFNSESGRCEEFTYGGCQGNDNRFDTLQQCGEQCGDVCTLPKEPGPCRGSFPRYFFNSESGRCEEFIYGGCQGNDNRFETLEDCGEQCGDVCTLPKDPGPCRGSFPRYFFNSESGRCEEFTYGGCQGNDNRFDTLQQCGEQCGDTDVCTLPSDTGPCEALILRYFFNSATKQCEKFTYGGCEGNGNNFETLEHCTDRCVGPA